MLYNIMGRTLRENIKKEQLAPYLIYTLRKWKQNTLIQKSENAQLTSKQVSWCWADVSDNDELPDIPWETNQTNNNEKITFIQEYKYRNT